MYKQTGHTIFTASSIFIVLGYTVHFDLEWKFKLNDTQIFYKPYIPKDIHFLL